MLKSGPQWTSPDHVFVNEAGEVVPRNDPTKARLLVAAGGTIPKSDAIRLGLVEGDRQAEAASPVSSESEPKLEGVAMVDFAIKRFQTDMKSVEFEEGDPAADEAELLVSEFLAPNIKKYLEANPPEEVTKLKDQLKTTSDLVTSRGKEIDTQKAEVTRLEALVKSKDQEIAKLKTDASKAVKPADDKAVKGADDKAVKGPDSTK